MKHVIEIMDHTGDEKVKFDPQDAESVQIAMERFEQLVTNGKKLAVQHNADGTSHNTRVFDPTAPRTTIMPQLVGG